MSQGIEEELFVVATKRKDGGIPHAAKILGGWTEDIDVVFFYATREEAETKAMFKNRAGIFYKVYRAVVRLEECDD